MLRRLVIFILCIFALFAGLECLMRAKEDVFAVLADKSLLREKLIRDSSSDTEVMILGTSRLLDAVDQGLFSESVARQTGRKIKTFNASVPGVNVEILERFVAVVSEKDEVKLVIIEASTPSLTQFPVDTSGQTVRAAEGALEVTENRFPDQLEEWLREWMSDHLAFVRKRKALQPKTLLKFFVVVTADFIDPNLWDRKGVGRNLINFKARKIPELAEDALVPEIVSPKASSFSTDHQTNDPIVGLMVRITRSLQGRGKTVVWVVPPVGGTASHIESNDERNKQYETAINLGGGQLLNYAMPALKSDYLRDPTHLNIYGRSFFSAALARDIVKLKAVEGGEGRGD